MDQTGAHDQGNPASNPSPSGYGPTADFTFLAPSGAFNVPYGVSLEFPSAHVPYEHLHASADEPPSFQPWQPMHTPMQHPASFPPTLSISPHALTPPGSGSASGRSGSSHGEASASPGASPVSASTPPAIGNLSLSHGSSHHHSHSREYSHHRPQPHRSSSHQSGNDSSASHGSTGSMRYVITGNESSGNESRGHKRRATKHADEDSDEDDEDDLPPRRGSGQSKRDAEADYNRRREEIRKQRIESEQRRRDELREGYRRLKDVLPVSSQKSSKVSLLDRATQHIRQIEQQNENLQLKLSQAEAELARLRQINETLMMRSVDVRPHGPPGYAA